MLLFVLAFSAAATLFRLNDTNQRQVSFSLDPANTPSFGATSAQFLPHLVP